MVCLFASEYMTSSFGPDEMLSGLNNTIILYTFECTTHPTTNDKESWSKEHLRGKQIVTRFARLFIYGVSY